MKQTGNESRGWEKYLPIASFLPRFPATCVDCSCSSSFASKNLWNIRGTARSLREADEWRISIKVCRKSTNIPNLENSFNRLHAFYKRWIIEECPTSFWRVVVTIFIFEALLFFFFFLLLQLFLLTHFVKRNFIYLIFFPPLTDALTFLYTNC